jgi:23S rRNA (pseudouridine1915-N3)-methyltransferase
VRLAIVALGRLSRGPETELVKDYVARAHAAGRALGFGAVEVIEVESRKPGRAAEGEALLAALAGFDHICACDEHGAPAASRAFADRLASLRDRGLRRSAFVIGGADGLAPAVLARAQELMSFGPQTWPHALARAMLAEQLYRAVSILAGSPYHRD